MCLDCNYTWQITFGKEEQGLKQACPNCKSLNVRRIKNELGWFWRSRGNRQVKIDQVKEK
jgi:phage FluMu protein Com